MRSRILGTGSYLPAAVLTNFDLKRMDTSDAWIRERTGIERRHIVLRARPPSTWPNTRRVPRLPPRAASRGSGPDRGGLVHARSAVPERRVMLQARLKISAVRTRRRGAAAASSMRCRWPIIHSLGESKLAGGGRRFALEDYQPQRPRHGHPVWRRRGGVLRPRAEPASSRRISLVTARRSSCSAARVGSRPAFIRKATTSRWPVPKCSRWP